MRYENILLEPEQKALLEAMVEAVRNVAQDRRESFILFDKSVVCFLRHPGFTSERKIHIADIDELVSKGLLSRRLNSNLLDIKPEGFAYYEQEKQSVGEPTKNVETTIRGYLDADEFKKKYPKTYKKWTESESILWASDSEQQLTTIGHLCREAMQEFATALVNEYKPPNVDEDIAHTKNRIQSVISIRKEQLGNKEKVFLDRLIDYWDALNGLVQRQEHGGQKKGNPLVWKDARRVVFQTAIVMFEISATLE